MTLLADLPVAGASSVVYLGTPEIAVAPLQALVASGCNVELVITRPDVRRGRGNLATASPVKLAAQNLGIRVSESLDDVVALAKQSDDKDLLGVVVAYGALIPMSVLSIVPMINVHFSLLPRWRGAAPVERAILAGDEKTGVCIMRVVEGLDQGEVYRQGEISILPTDTLASVRNNLLSMSLPLLVDAVKNGTGRGVAQTGEVLYAKKISAQEMQINWGLTALEIDRLIRVGGAYTNIGDKRLKIIAAKISSDTDTTHVVGAISLISRNQCEIRTGAGSISLVEVQPEGKSVMSVAGWLNGARIEPGAVFG